MSSSEITPISPDFVLQAIKEIAAVDPGLVATMFNVRVTVDVVTADADIPLVCSESDAGELSTSLLGLLNGLFMQAGYQERLALVFDDETGAVSGGFVCWVNNKKIEKVEPTVQEFATNDTT